MTLLTFELSCDVFWGYSIELEPEWFRSIDSLIQCVKTSLLKQLRSNNLEILYDEAKKMTFHIHDYSMDTLCSLDPRTIVYICNHSHSCNRIA